MTYTKSIAHFQRWDGKTAIVILDRGVYYNDDRYCIDSYEYQNTETINQPCTEAEFNKAFTQALEHFKKQII